MVNKLFEKGNDGQHHRIRFGNSEWEADDNGLDDPRFVTQGELVP